MLAAVGSQQIQAPNSDLNGCEMLGGEAVGHAGKGLETHWHLHLRARTWWHQAAAKLRQAHLEALIHKEQRSVTVLPQHKVSAVCKGTNLLLSVIGKGGFTTVLDVFAGD